MLFWNIRGMGNPARVKQMKEIVAEHKCDIIGVQETIKQGFSVQELSAMVASQNFVWNWISAQGHSGGILLGVKEDLLQVEDWMKGSAVVRNRVSNLRWKVVVVYGPVDHTLSRGFLQELREVVMNEYLPTVLGGDFNLVLEVNDKSTKQVNVGLMGEFNDFVAELALLEIKKAGGKYTWSNRQSNPIFSNIDRTFVTTEWENRV